MSWLKPGSECVEHLVRASTDGTAEWLVAYRSLENGKWEVYVAFGKSGSRGSTKVLGHFDLEAAARALAKETATEKRKDARYSDVSKGVVNNGSKAHLQISTVPACRDLLPELRDLERHSAGMCRGQIHGARVVVRENPNFVEITGVCEADDLGARMSLAIINHVLTPGTSAIVIDVQPVPPPKEWAMQMRDVMNEETRRRAEDAGLIPKAIDFTAIAQAQSGIWAMF